MDQLKKLQSKVTRDQVNLLHVAVVAPILGYAGLQVRKASKEKGSPELKNIALGLLIVAVLVLLYHGYALYTRHVANSCDSDSDSSDEESEGYQRGTID